MMFVVVLATMFLLNYATLSETALEIVCFLYDEGGLVSSVS
jgi:hypothetical protein